LRPRRNPPPLAVAVEFAALAHPDAHPEHGKGPFPGMFESATDANGMGERLSETFREGPLRSLRVADRARR